MYEIRWNYSVLPISFYEEAVFCRKSTGPEDLSLCIFVSLSANVDIGRHHHSAMVTLTWMVILVGALRMQDRKLKYLENDGSFKKI